MSRFAQNYRSGFTLIELLIVIGIIGTLASVTILAINPSKQLVAARDGERVSNAKQLQSALNQYLIDNGVYPNASQMQITPKPVCRATTPDSTCVDISPLIPNYLAALPQDPSETNPKWTGYHVSLSSGRAVVTSFYAGNFIGNGLIGWWKFNETSGTVAYDSSGNAKNGTVNNGIWAGGKFSNALSFNGATTHVLLPASSLYDVQALTISAWTNAATYNQNALIFEKTTNGSYNTQYSCFISGNYIYFRTYNASAVGDDLYAGSPPFGPSWNNIVCMYDGVKKYIYLNGIERASANYSQTLATNPAGIAAMGAVPIAAGYFYNGLMDDVRLYNRALSSSEIQQIYAGNG